MRYLTRKTIVVAVLSAMAVMSTLLWTLPGLSEPVEARQTRVEISTPVTTDPISFALSPDGQQLVFVATEDGAPRLWWRRLTAMAAQPLAGTERATLPFWSPDSRSIGFVAEGKLKRLDIGGGQPRTLTDGAMPRGGTWNEQGIILFVRSIDGPLFRIAASGGEATPVPKPDNGPGHFYPQFLPGGRQFLAFGLGRPGVRGVDVVSLETGEAKRLTVADTNGVYLSSGWLLWVQAGTLMAQRLDLERKELTGNSVAVADPVAFEAFGGAVSVSASGTMAYRAGAASRRQLRWFDRTGKAVGVLGAPDVNALMAPSVAPDGRRAVVYRTMGDNVMEGNSDIWLFDGAATRRFTFDPDRDRRPLWSPDGNRIAFDRRQKGVRNLLMKLASGVGGEELLVESAEDKHLTHWSHDGRFLLYESNSPQTNWDLWVLPLEGDRKPSVFLKTSANDQAAQFSPDGNWVAYISNESGRFEVYVRPFVSASAAAGTARAGPWRVSTVGGISPHWGSDGKELYYIAPDGKMMSAPITVRGAAIEPGAPVALFQTQIFGGGTLSGQGKQYDVARDGRFLINTVLDDAVAPPITLLQNWKAPAP